jgi:hypothetical protein
MAGSFCRKCGLPWRLPCGCRCRAAGGRGSRHPFCDRCGVALSPGHSCDGPPASYDAFIETEGVKIAKGCVEQLSSYMDRHEQLGTQGLVLCQWQNSQWTALRRL